MGKIIKIIVIAAIVCFPMFGLFWFLNYAMTSNPLPHDAVTTIEEFFIGLQEKRDQDFFRCRELLSVSAKTPLLIEQNTVENINHHFDRVRNYLIERSGPDFASDMKIEPYEFGFKVTFNHDIVLRCSTETHWGYDEKTHFSFASIHDFPMMIMPDLGVEQRNLDLNRMIESLDNAEAIEEDVVEDATIEEILALKPGESPAIRLDRLINNFHYADMLDKEHALFDAILKEFPHDPVTLELLREITKEDSSYAPHLIKQAQKIIDQQTQSVIK